MSGITYRLLWIGCLLLSIAGCAGWRTYPDPPPRNIAVSVTTPTELRQAVDANWEIEFSGGVAPYRVKWHFAGGAEQDEVVIDNAVSPLTTIVEMRNPDLMTTAEHTYSVEVYDALGIGGFSTGTYRVDPVTPAPAFGEIVCDGVAKTLSAGVNWPYADVVTITLTVAGAEGTLVQSVASQGGTAVFPLNSLSYDVLTGLTSTASLSAADTRGITITTTAAVDVPGYELAPDTLYAIPLKTQCKVGEQVTVVVATGALAHPFQYVRAVALTMPFAASYIRLSQNMGLPDNTPPGTSEEPVDGIWALMGIAEFLKAPDSVSHASSGFGPPYTEIGGGMIRYDFVVYPIDGHELTGAGGALFNIKLEFRGPVECVLGFQEFEGVNRTFYAGADEEPQFWSDISNDHPGIPNSITVN